MPVNLLDLQTYTDDRGHLTVVDGEPFQVQRAFWVTQIQGERGGHAHETCQQILVAMQGIVYVVLEEEEKRTAVALVDPRLGLHVLPGTSLTYRATPDAVLLVLCSEPYDAEEYVQKGETV